ncbi:hypothetical protein OG252_46745 [Streptomyces sp. NBC_01352]|uniref:hypothetical protein n=1 Tax=unclassified Streptomyces TaxID=2593676 RepID=UPI002E36FE07|nr:hypothetical protein [Streptomyces sp. NBC_01352]
MSRFNAQEVACLSEHLLGRLATTGTSGKPHVVPIRRLKVNAQPALVGEVLGSGAPA